MARAWRDRTVIIDAHIDRGADRWTSGRATPICAAHVGTEPIGCVHVRAILCNREVRSVFVGCLYSLCLTPLYQEGIWRRGPSERGISPGGAPSDATLDRRRGRGRTPARFPRKIVEHLLHRCACKARACSQQEVAVVLDHDAGLRREVPHFVFEVLTASKASKSGCRLPSAACIR